MWKTDLHSFGIPTRGLAHGELGCRLCNVIFTVRSVAHIGLAKFGSCEFLHAHSVECIGQMPNTDTVAYPQERCHRDRVPGFSDVYQHFDPYQGNRWGCDELLVS
jgi:hypothetical protein